ncbi:MAG: YIP1 family protein [Gemmatimonadota bacterium]
MSAPLTTPPPFDLQPPPPPIASGSAWSTWEDVLDIFYAPREVFERRRDGRYMIPLVISLVISVVIYLLAQQMNEALQDVEFARAMARQGNMTPEQIAQSKVFAEKFRSVGLYFIPVGLAIVAWISGLVIMLLSSMMGGRVNFAQGTTIAVLAGMPELLGRTLVSLQGLFLDTSTAATRYSFSFNASRFMGADTNNWLLKVGALADPFVIWGLFLVGLGVYVIGKMEKEKAAVLAIIYALVVMALAR